MSENTESLEPQDQPKSAPDNRASEGPLMRAKPTRFARMSTSAE